MVEEMVRKATVRMNAHAVESQMDDVTIVIVMVWGVIELMHIQDSELEASDGVTAVRAKESGGEEMLSSILRGFIGGVVEEVEVAVKAEGERKKRSEEEKREEEEAIMRWSDALKSALGDERTEQGAARVMDMMRAMIIETRKIDQHEAID